MMNSQSNHQTRNTGHVLEVSDETFQNEVLSSKTPVFVDFWAPWCGPCRIIGPIFEELAQEFQGRVKFAKINVDENPVIATQMGVQAIPMMALFKDGQPVKVTVGVRPRTELAGLLRGTLKLE